MVARSAVYKDEDGYVILVAHGKDNPLERLGVKLTGLLHYCLREAGGKLQIFDGANGVFHAVDGWWEGLDEDAVTLLEASAYWDLGNKLDDRYFNTINLYDDALKNDLVREALA